MNTNEQPPQKIKHGFKNNSLVLKKHYAHDESFEYNLHFFCNILNDLHVRTLQDTGCPVPKMYARDLPDGFSCRHETPSGIGWTPI